MSEIGEQVRWGILGTAGIAESAFLPALRETGDGVAVAVGSRDLERGRSWAAEQIVARAVQGYGAVIDDPDVEAVYIPLPNGLHADWTIAALEAGKTVLCEKPLCGTVEDTERVLAAARSAAGSLWEAFVFPFHEQMDRVRAMLAGGTIGEVREIAVAVPLHAGRPGQHPTASPTWPGARSRTSAAIRSAWRACCSMPSRISRGRSPTPSGRPTAPTRRCGARCLPRRSAAGVLVRLPQRIRHAHPRPGHRGRDPHDGPVPSRPRATRSTIVRDGKTERQPATTSGEMSFTPAIRHIHRVVRGLEEPRHLAVDEAMGNAKAIAALLDSARTRVEDRRRSTRTRTEQVCGLVPFGYPASPVSCRSADVGETDQR